MLFRSFNVSTTRTTIAEIGQGTILKPYQRPHPPIVVTAVAPHSKGVMEAAKRGWMPISANFLLPEWVASHWPRYVEGREAVGAKADPADWRVAKSIFVADDEMTGFLADLRASGATQVVMLSTCAAAGMVPTACEAQCCLTDLFSCCRKPPAAFAVAPVAAPIMAPVPAPPPPVVVPVQQVSYVPETTYKTQYQCVPVTSYKPTTEIDPCTGCQRECMAPVTQYVQQAVNVPVTQYRAVYSTKYVQMQPGYTPGAAPAMDRAKGEPR